jgi:predicted site-specific integrase-resolvase
MGQYRCTIIPMIYGYARVSTAGQSVHAQVRQLRAAGAAKVYRETASGTKTERAQQRRVLDHSTPAMCSWHATRPAGAIHA